MSAPCTCWQQVNEKLHPLGVRLSDKLTSFAPTKDLDLVEVYQLPTEPITGKFKSTMPRSIGFPFCPFCGQKLPTVKEAA